MSPGMPPYVPRGTRLLVVDDEPALRRVLEFRLGRMGFEVLTAATADEARELVESGLRIDGVLSDIRMPGEMNGVALARYLQQHHPDIAVILCTGFAEEAADGSIADLGIQILRKPFSASSLTEALVIALDLNEGGPR